VTPLDYAFVGVLALSTAWGVWRGLVREVISLAGWVLAFVAANIFSEPLADALEGWISNPDLRAIVAFIAIFVVVLTVVTLAAIALSKALKSTGLRGLDRTLGGLFGLARGLFIAILFAIVAGLTSFPQHPIWTASWSGPLLGRTVVELKPWLPPALAQRLKYN
jgi:membrane protein required for colicin V production